MHSYIRILKHIVMNKMIIGKSVDKYHHLSNRASSFRTKPANVSWPLSMRYWPLCRTPYPVSLVQSVQSPPRAPMRHDFTMEKARHFEYTASTDNRKQRYVNSVTSRPTHLVDPISPSEYTHISTHSPPLTLPLTSCNHHLNIRYLTRQSYAISLDQPLNPKN